MLEGERAKLLRMEDQLRKRVVGQEEALEAVSKAVRRARARDLVNALADDRLAHDQGRLAVV
jgi:ATP-dependent Clp protease ATP-binding subunit ClpA